MSLPHKFILYSNKNAVILSFFFLNYEILSINYFHFDTSKETSKNIY